MTIHITPRGISTVLALSTTASTPVNVPTFSTLFASPIVFGTGNGTQAAFTIGVPSGVAFPSLANLQVARTDWQGRQLLYPTARTNLALSSNLAVNWYTAAASYGTASTTTPSGTGDAYPLIPNITLAQHSGILHVPTGGASNTVSVFFDVAPDGYNYAFAQILFSTGGGANGSTYNLTTGAVTAGNSTYSTTNTISSEQIIQLPNGYWRIILNCSLTAPITFNNSGHIYVSANGTDNGSFAGNGTSAILVANGQIVGDTPIGSLIVTPTTGSAALTDYTLSGTTVSLAQAPARGATLDWNGNVPLIAAPAYLLSNPGSVPAFVTISQNGALAVIPAQGSPSSAIMVPAGGNIVVSAGAQSLFSGIVASGSVNLVVQPCETTIIP